MKSRVFLAVLLLVTLSSISSIWSVFAQQGQVSTTINLAYVTVNLSYPSAVQPGDSVTLSAQATSRADLQMDKLVVQLYVPIQNDLQQILAGTIAKGVAMKPGSQASSTFRATIPSGALRDSLIAVVTENVRLMTSTFSYRCPSGVCYFEPNTTYPYGQYIPKVPEGFERNDISFAPLAYVSSSSPLSSSSSGEQISSTLKLDYVNVQLSYPAIVIPGQSVTLNAKAMSHDDFEMDSLDVQVYISNQNNLKQIAAGNVARGVIMTTGSWVSRDISFSVPSDALAGSLLAVVTEDVRWPPAANAFGYGYTISVDQNTTYPYNYRMSPAPVGTQANTISYLALSYVNANKPTSTSTQSGFTNTNSLTANQRQSQVNIINNQNQANPNPENVQFLYAIIAIVSLAGAIAVLVFRSKKSRKQIHIKRS